MNCFNTINATYKGKFYCNYIDIYDFQGHSLKAIISMHHNINNSLNSMLSLDKIGCPTISAQYTIEYNHYYRKHTISKTNHANMPLLFL